MDNGGYSLIGICGGKSKPKLFFVPEAKENPEKDYEISEYLLFRYLLNDAIHKLFEDVKIIFGMSTTLNEIDLASKITEVETYKWLPDIGSNEKDNNFVVFQTNSQKNGEIWWSLDKNGEYVVIQKSREKGAVKNKFKGKNRNRVKSIAQGLKGKGSIKDLFVTLWIHMIVDVKCQSFLSSCESLIPLVMKKLTEIQYEYPQNYFTYSALSAEELVPEMAEIIDFLTNVSEWHPLLCLTYLGDIQQFDRILEKGFFFGFFKSNINGIYSKSTLLNSAIFFSKTEMVRHLLEKKKANARKCDAKGRNALHMAALFSEKEEIINLLFSYKMEINARDKSGMTALHYAIMASNFTVAKHLIRHDADIKILDPTDHSPLHLAAHYTKDNNILELLLTKVGMDECDSTGITALHSAAIASNAAPARYLLKRGADINRRDKRGRTPIHVAASFAKDMDFFNVFLANDKADLECCDDRNLTVLDYAKINQHGLAKEIVSRIEEKIKGNQSLHERGSQSRRHLAAPNAKVTFLANLGLMSARVANVFKLFVCAAVVAATLCFTLKYGDDNIIKSEIVRLIARLSSTLAIFEDQSKQLVSKTNANQRSSWLDYIFKTKQCNGFSDNPYSMTIKDEFNSDDGASKMIGEWLMGYFYYHNITIIEWLTRGLLVFGFLIALAIMFMCVAVCFVMFHRELNFNGKGLFGGKYKKMWLFVPDAGKKPGEKHEISEPALFRFLFNEQNLEKLDEAEAETCWMLRISKIIDKNAIITQVETHESSMGSLKTWFNAFHVFIVFKTTSEINGNYWWSLEKNTNHVVLQRSRNKDDVKDKLYGKERKQVKLIQRSLKGKGSIKDLFGILLTHIVIQKLYYNVAGSNCQSFVSFISKQITAENGYKYKVNKHLEVYERAHNSRYTQNLQFINSLTGVTGWPTLFTPIYLENTDFFDKVMKSGKYDINALHGGITPLHFAIRLDKTNMVKHLLEHPINADPTRRDSKFGGNALHVAVTYTLKTEIIDLLLAHPKVKVDDVDGDGQTALHYAALVSNVMAVEKLIEKGANPNIFDKIGRSPLHVAAYFGKRTKIIDLILQAQKHNHVDDDKAQDGSTALHYAAVSSNERMVQHLINKGADLHSRDNNGHTPLHSAVAGAKDMKIIDLLLRKIKDEDMLYQYINDGKLLYHAYSNKNLLGAEIAAQLKRIDSKQKLQSWADKILEVLRRRVIDIPAKLLLKFVKEVTNFSSCFTPLDRLQIENAKNNQEIDENLKEGKFDINSRDQNGDTPLFWAIRANNVEKVRLLLKRGADPTKLNNEGLTPFQVAATQEKDFKILDLLLTNDKVDINDGGKSGYTLLHWAIAWSNVTVVGLLLSKGANPNVADQNGATPLHVAAYCAKTTDVIDMILKNEVDINGRDKYGQTALHYAVGGNREDNVRYLLKKGADRTICDKEGWSPLHVAKAFNKNSAILDLLLANENKTEIDEMNNTEDLELPPSQKDVANVNSLDNSGAQQHIQGKVKKFPILCKAPRRSANRSDESKLKSP